MSMSFSRRVTAVVLMMAAALAGGGLANAADAAGSVNVQSGKLVVTGGSERNAFFVTGNGGGVFTVSDGQPGASISAGSGCTKTGATTVRCTGVTTSIAVSTGADNDAVRLRSTNLESTIRGGDGNDLLIGSSTARDLILGDAGDDTLNGSNPDNLNGGAGVDKCSGTNNKVNCES